MVLEVLFDFVLESKEGATAITNVRSSPKSKVPKEKHIFNYEEDNRKFLIYRVVPAGLIGSQIRTHPIVYAREING